MRSDAVQGPEGDRLRGAAGEASGGDAAHIQLLHVDHGADHVGASEHLGVTVGGKCEA